LYNRILSPLDGSQLAECTLEQLISIATGCRVPEVILLTVMESMQTPTWWPDSQDATSEMSANLESRLKQAQQKAEEYLENTAQMLKKAGVAARTVVLEKTENQQVAAIILGYAQNNNIDLIVMSTHGRSGVSHWSYGNVADKVVRSSTVPVMIVAPQGCRLAT
jgi:nucleotide-binding universal stress UspA family protein